MTTFFLLESLKKFIEEKTKDIILPTAATDKSRAAKLHKMRLPHSSAAKKYVPYILIKAINGKDASDDSSQIVRIIFAVYNEDEEIGSDMLINLVDTVRIALLRKVVIGDCFKLDEKKGIEYIYYPDDTAPYFVGELIATFKMPPVRREIIDV